MTTHSDRLTPEQVAEIRERLETHRAHAKTWGGFGAERAHEATDDIAALLAHAAALEAENTGLRKVAEAARDCAEFAREMAYDYDVELADDMSAAAEDTLTALDALDAAQPEEPDDGE